MLIFVLQSTTTSFSFIHENPLLVGSLGTGFGGFGGGFGGNDVSSRSRNSGGSAYWNAAALRIPLSLSRRRACFRKSCRRRCIYFTVNHATIAMMLRMVIETLMPIPALAAVLSPLLAGAVSSFMADVLVGVLVSSGMEVEVEGSASPVAATS